MKPFSSYRASASTYILNPSTSDIEFWSKIFVLRAILFDHLKNIRDPYEKKLN